MKVCGVSTGRIPIGRRQSSIVGVGIAVNRSGKGITFSIILGESLFTATLRAAVVRSPGLSKRRCSMSPSIICEGGDMNEIQGV